MNNEPLISIVVPVYNVEQYIRQCLNSIINQTYNNIEIVCVDDCSTDHSLEILKEYDEKYDNITLVSLEQNRGVSFARNKALSFIKGDYVCFIDSDDYIEKDFCSKLFSAFVDDVDLVFGGHVKLNTFGQKISPWTPQISSTSNVMSDVFLLTKHRNVSQKMFKVKIIKENNIQFDESLHYMEDALFLTTYMQFCRKARGIKEPLYIVRINKDSLCRSSKYQKRRGEEKLIAMSKINKISANKINKTKKPTPKTKNKYF